MIETTRFFLQKEDVNQIALRYKIGTQLHHISKTWGSHRGTSLPCPSMGEPPSPVSLPFQTPSSLSTLLTSGLNPNNQTGTPKGYLLNAILFPLILMLLLLLLLMMIIIFPIGPSDH